MTRRMAVCEKSGETYVLEFHPLKVKVVAETRTGVENRRIYDEQRITIQGMPKHYAIRTDEENVFEILTFNQRRGDGFRVVLQDSPEPD